MLWALALAMGTALAEQPDAPAEAEPVDEAKPWDREGWGWGALPVASYNSDEGFGFGAMGSLYRYDGSLQPYKTGVQLALFGTTRGLQVHQMRVDALEVGNIPLRLTVRGAFEYTPIDNYCGIGPEVTCDPDVAEANADQLGLTGDARDEAVNRYYRTRYLYPDFRINARYAVDPMPHRLEVLVGYRGSYVRSGSLTEAGPWPNSLYEEDFGEGERGFVSVVQAGLMLDNRDNEPSPTSGYWIEGTVRAAPSFLGSEYAYVGFNTTLRGYTTLFTDRLVFADRIVVDAISGDAPTRELATPGGFQRYTGYGSQFIGRGIRQRRFLGETLAAQQAELRWLAAPFSVADVDVDIHLVGFGDLGFVGAEFSDFGRMFETPLFGGGGGLRVAVDKNFIVRADFGFSGFESGPGVYIDVDNLF